MRFLETLQIGECFSWANNQKNVKFLKFNLKYSNLIVGNIGTNQGVGYAELVNQLSDKLIEEFEQRLGEKDELIALLKQKS